MRTSATRCRPRRFGHLAVASRQWTELTEKRPGVVREIGRGALQVWQSVLEARGHDHGERELTVVFTDLVDFSDWALRAGDDDTLRLLREVAVAIEPPVKRHGGEVVKRLGDGMMAVFISPQAAFEAVVEANDEPRADQGRRATGRGSAPACTPAIRASWAATTSAST